MDSRGWLARFEDLVRERTGLVFRADLFEELEAAIVDEMRQEKLTRELYYRKLLDDGAPAFGRLIERITVGETYFLREPEQLEFIRRRVLPQITSAKPAGEGVRIWSAGCASGEEPYTLAILLRESKLASLSKVIGTDISEDRIARARTGHYRPWSLRALPEQLRETYFERRGNHWEVVPEIRRQVEFRQMNLTQEGRGPAGLDLIGLDLIVCRNVLIYFDQHSVAAAARQLIAALGADGWLFLGASDPRIDEYVDCRVVETDAGLAYRRPSAPRSVAEQQRRPVNVGVHRETPSNHGFSSTARGKLGSVRRGDRPTAGTKPLSVGARDKSPDRKQSSERPTIGGLKEAIDGARALADRGDIAAADRLVLAGLDLYPTSAELMYLHGLLLNEAGRRAEGITAVRRALYLDRGYAVAHLMLGTLLLKDGDREGARRAVENASRLLSILPPEQVVDGAGGAPAGRLLEAARMQLRIIGEA